VQIQIDEVEPGSRNKIKKPRSKMLEDMLVQDVPVRSSGERLYAQSSTFLCRACRLARRGILVLLSAHCDISCRTSTRVLGRQVGSCWWAYELKGVFVANGRRPSG